MNAGRDAVLGALLAARERRVASSDEAPHLLWSGAEGGRALGGVQDAESTAGAGADIDQATAALEAIDGDLRRRSDLFSLEEDRFRDQAVLGVDRIDDLELAREVDIQSTGIPLLR